MAQQSRGKRGSWRQSKARARWRGAPWESLEARLALDATVVFNEVMYHPAGNAPGLEWIELKNLQAIDMDLSGWSLDAGVKYDFAAGTVLRAGGYLVVSANPQTLAANGYAGALGPFTGVLDNAGETLE